MITYLHLGYDNYVDAQFVNETRKNERKMHTICYINLLKQGCSMMDFEGFKEFFQFLKV